jgi:hypothetical protein
VSYFPGHTARQLRERYENYLAPFVKLSVWTDAEDALLLEKFNIHGSRWSQLKQFFPGRSATNVKNRWAVLNSRRSRTEWEQRVKPQQIISETAPGTTVTDSHTLDGSSDINPWLGPDVDNEDSTFGFGW